MSVKAFFVVGFLIVLVGAGFYFYEKSYANEPKVISVNTQRVLTKAVATKAVGKVSSMKKYTVTGANFSFDPKEISVKKGDTVQITFKNAEGFHDFMIDEFGVKTNKVQAGSQEVVKFVASKTGEFQYYCSVGQHRANGMWGTLKVN
jgi:plastocyanin